MKSITFLHTADLHLDSPMVGLSELPKGVYQRLLNSTFTAFQKVVDTAISNEVDFVIIAGDIYDGEDRSIRAQVRFHQEMERLALHKIPVFLVHGNHDHLEGTWTHIPLPENVTIFGKDVECISYQTKQNTHVHLYGFSYPKRQVIDRKIADYHKKIGADFHIGILHGNDGGSSSHGNYAPFHVRELLEKQFDYWALGHIHKSKIIYEQPPIVYPGNTQGRHHKENGPKGCYLVNLTEAEAKLDWIVTSDIEWITLEIDSGECSTFQDVYHLCTEKINQTRGNQKLGKIIKLVLLNVQAMDGQENISNGELLELLQEIIEEEDNFIWISEIELKNQTLYDKEYLKHEDGFYKELFFTLENYEQLSEAINPLYGNVQARKYLTALSDDEQASLLADAERTLLQLLNEKS